MGLPLPPVPALLSVGLLYPDAKTLDSAVALLVKTFGPVLLDGPEYPFVFSDYYTPEMGPSLLRRFLILRRDADEQDEAALTKLATNRLEQELARFGRRAVNIDPGYVTLAKCVVTSTKDATYRVYLGSGIFAQPMLFFRDKTFQPWEWTYADYRAPEAVGFFNRARDLLRQAPRA